MDFQKWWLFAKQKKYIIIKLIVSVSLNGPIASEYSKYDKYLDMNDSEAILKEFKQFLSQNDNDSIHSRIPEAIAMHRKTV